MAELRDLPGQLDVVLYVGRPTTLTLNWPSTLAGRTFTCQVSYGGAAPTTYTVAVSLATMTIVLAATDYAVESGPGRFAIIETTGGLTTPVIAGALTVTRNPGASSTTSTVTVASSTVTVALGVNIGVVAVGQIPTFTNLAAVIAGNPGPATGTEVRTSSPEQLLYYNGSAWAGIRSVQRMGTATPTATSGTTRANINSDTFPDQGCAGTLAVSLTFRYQSGSSGDQFEAIINIAGSDVVVPFFVVPPALLGSATVCCSVAMAAGASKAIVAQVVRFFGTGTIVVDQTNMTSLFTPS